MLPRWFEERLRRGDERGIHRRGGDEKGGMRQGEMGKGKDAPR